MLQQAEAIPIAECGHSIPVPQQYTDLAVWQSPSGVTRSVRNGRIDLLETGSLEKFELRQLGGRRSRDGK